MKTKSILVLLLSVCLCVLPAFGTIHFNDGGTHYIDYEINDAVWVDYQAPGMETTVNLITGGIIRHQVGDENYLHGYTDSHINISGGIVEGHLYAHDNSQVDLSSGWVRRILHAYNGSQVTVSGGHIGDHIYLWDHSQVDFSNGSVFNSIGTHANSELTVSGGTIGADMFACENSKINFSGGLVGWDLTVLDHSQVDFSGGTVGYDLKLEDSGVLTIYGSDFAVDGTPFGDGELYSIYGGQTQYEPTRNLTGTLTNGDPLANDFYIGHDASIILIPEPFTLLLLGLGGFVLRIRKQ